MVTCGGWSSAKRIAILGLQHGREAVVEGGGPGGVAMMPGLGEAGSRDAGRDLDDAESHPVVIGPQRTREAIDGELARHIGGVIGQREMAGGRADIDDVAALAGQHARNDRPRDADQARDVHFDDAGEVVGVASVEPVAPAGIVARIVDEDGDVPPTGRRAARQGGGRGGVGDVEREGEEALAEPRRHRIQPVALAGGADDADAALDQHLGKRCADAARRAGHQRDVARLETRWAHAGPPTRTSRSPKGRPAGRDM